MISPKIGLFFLAVFSIIFAAFTIFFCAETAFRSKEKGLIGAVKSYFVAVEVPKSRTASDSWVISDDELGYRLNPDLPGINEYSMAEREVTMPKPAGVKRIVILGDSIPTTGNPTFVDILKEKFKDDQSIEIINAAIPGYTNYQELVFLKKYVAKIEPDLVILCYVLNDNYKFLHVFDEKNNMLFSKEAKNSLEINTKLDLLIDKSYFLTYVKIMLTAREKERQLKKPDFWWNETIDFNTAWREDTWVDIDTQVQTMHSLIQQRGAQFMVVTFPLMGQIENYTSPLKKSETCCDLDYEKIILRPQRNMIAVTQKHAITHLDLFPAFYDKMKFDGEKLYTDALHLTTAGHQLTAEKLYPLILEITKINNKEPSSLIQQPAATL